MAAVVLAAGTVAAWVWRDTRLVVPGWLAIVAGLILLFLGGHATLARRRHSASLRDRARMLERERTAAAQFAVETERARIARELHDVVSHTVSVMVVQAGAARQTVRAAPDEATRALLAVEASGRDAMTELRRMLDLLAPAADGATETDLAPQPSLSRLDRLVDRIAFAGLPVEVTIDGEPRSLPQGIDLTAYRIVQEALTNALKHAPNSQATVTVRYTDRHLRLEVLNTGPSVLSGSAPSQAPNDWAGRGLLGLRERVAVYGGDLDARRRLGGGYRLRARIPLDPP